MKFKILCWTALLAMVSGLVACDSSSNPSSSNDNQGKGSKNENQNVVSDTEPATCDVSTTSNSVTTVQTMPGVATYTSTVTDNGSRYVSIKSEYWYAKDSDAASECERMKTEASHWLDGSMTVSCSGHKIFVDEIDEGSLREHEADFRENCEVFMEAYGGQSTSSGSTPENNDNGEFRCDVNRSANSVKIVQSYKGYYFEESATPNQAGYVVGVRTITFKDAEEAAEECAYEKEEASYSNDNLYKVECNGKNIVITKKIETLDLNTYEDYYNAWCAEQRRRLQSGELDLYI